MEKQLIRALAICFRWAVIQLLTLINLNETQNLAIHLFTKQIEAENS